MKKISAVISLCLVLLLAITSCSSSDDERGHGKQRRSLPESSAQTTTTTTEPAVSTIPIDSQPLQDAQEIKQNWNENSICELISPSVAQEILGMTTTPEPRYLYVEEIGARCSYSSGAGDQIYVELSTMSYKESRELDSALNAPGQPVVVNGVAGVYKENALGSFYELNIKGDQSNQWVGFAPTKKQAENVAKAIIKSLVN